MHLCEFAARAMLSRLFLVIAIVLSQPAAAQQRTWLPIENDGLRDPANPAVKLLQPPGEALSRLAPDSAGNLVRWVQALEQAQIKPLSSIHAETKIQTYERDMFLNLRGGMPVVRFPHGIHTKWLDCSNCHDHLFKREAGKTKISMFLILQGEQCGVCHGAVAFPLTECSRCHSVKREDAIAELQREAADTGVPLPSVLPAGMRAPLAKTDAASAAGGSAGEAAE